MGHSKETLDRLRREQIARLKKQRAEWMRQKEEKHQKILADRKAAQEAARKEMEKLQQPCVRVWRIGRTVLWEPPATVDQLKPAGYWLSEQLPDGTWTAHGDYLPSDVREGRLFGDSPCQVEVVYPGYLSRGKSSPTIEETAGENRFAVSRVRYYCTLQSYGEEYVNRWRRVLAAFGVVNGKKGHASRPLVWPLDPPMTVEEAERYLNQEWQQIDGQQRDPWAMVLPILKRLTGWLPPMAEEKKTPPRMAQIMDACDDFTGRRCTDGRPYVRPLRRQAAMPDISTEERDDAYLQLVADEEDQQQ